MKLFRGKNPDNVPAEVQDYYQSQQSEHKSVAWLLAFATFVLTLVLILGLFFGGKWAYRKIANRDKNAPSEVAKPQANTEETPATTPDETSEPDDSEEPAVSGNSDTPQTSSTNTNTPSPATTPNTGPSQLVQTGEDYPY